MTYKKSKSIKKSKKFTKKLIILKPIKSNISKDKRWRPKNGQLFYYILFYLNKIKMERFSNNNKFHKTLIKVNNYFQTEEKAKITLRKHNKLMKEIR